MSEISNYQRILCFDFGSKRVGIAIGQMITGQARPLDPVKVDNGKPNWQLLDPIFKEWQPSAVIVGIPINMDGSMSELGLRADKFRRRLAAQYDLPAHRVDERLTSFEAKGIQLQQDRRKRDFGEHSVDGLAAALIFETWIEHFYETGEADFHHPDLKPLD